MWQAIPASERPLPPGGGVLHALSLRPSSSFWLARSLMAKVSSIERFQSRDATLLAAVCSVFKCFSPARSTEPRGVHRQRQAAYDAEKTVSKPHAPIRGANRISPQRRPVYTHEP